MPLTVTERSGNTAQEMAGHLRPAKSAEKLLVLEVLLWHLGRVMLSVSSLCDPQHWNTRSTQFKQPQRGSLIITFSQLRCTHLTTFPYWDMIALLNSKIYFTHAGDLSKLYTFIAKEAKESEATFSASVSLVA